MNIKIISASVRNGRNSHRLALYFQQYLADHHAATAEILDLREYDFPLFHERLQYTKDPDPRALEFADKVRSSDGILVVTPEYNGGYPASLKNVVDLLYPEWKRKPIAIATASDGSFGGTQVITSILFSFWKIGAWVVPAMFPTPNVQDAYDETGRPVDQAFSDKKAKRFIGELIWCIEAGKRGGD